MNKYIFVLTRSVREYVDVVITASTMEEAEEIMESKREEGDICWCDKCKNNDSIQDEFIQHKIQCHHINSKDFYKGCGSNEHIHN